jgi:hypothetical protein
MNTRYKIIWVDGNPKFEHRHLMEMVLGRKLLKKEIIHHINGDCKDNRICNLQILSQSYHISKHSNEYWLHRKYKYVAVLPTASVIGETLAIKKKNPCSPYVTVACSNCSKLYWLRKDRMLKKTSQCCSASCKHGWRKKNGLNWQGDIPYVKTGIRQ